MVLSLQSTNSRDRSQDARQVPRSPICSRRLLATYDGHRRWADLHKGTMLGYIGPQTRLTLAEFGLLCTHPRKGSRERSAAAASRFQPWPIRDRFSLFAHGARQSSCLVFVERLGSSSVSALSDLHLASDQAREAHTDAPSSLLPPLAIRGPEHTRGPNERASGEHTH
jgi:hypothetical protein